MGKKKRLSKFLAFFVCVTKISFVSALPSQVIVIPNAEVLTNGQLSQTGLERAGALEPYFTMTSSLLQFGQPSAFFASKPIFFGTLNTPCAIETIAPTAESLALPIHSPYGPGQETILANFILSDPRYHGRNVIIAWQQAQVPTLIQAFGYTPPAIPTNNLTFVLTFPVTSPVVVGVSQHLLVGDP